VHFITHCETEVSMFFFLIKYFVTFVRFIILFCLLKHCCKVVLAFSQVSLNSWKRSTSYKQRWQIKLGSGSLADTCNRHYGEKTMSDNAWMVLRLHISASNCLNYNCSMSGKGEGIIMVYIVLYQHVPGQTKENHRAHNMSVIFSAY
jgi:hypothetical protein